VRPLNFDFRRLGCSGFSLTEIMVGLGVSTILSLGAAGTFIQLSQADRQGQLEKNLTQASSHIISGLNLRRANCGQMMTFPMEFKGNRIVRTTPPTALPVTINIGGQVFQAGNAVNLGDMRVQVEYITLANGRGPDPGRGINCNTNQPVVGDRWTADLMLSVILPGTLNRSKGSILLGRLDFMVQGNDLVGINSAQTLSISQQNCEAWGQGFDAGGPGRCVTRVRNFDATPLDYCDWHQSAVAEDTEAGPPTVNCVSRQRPNPAPDPQCPVGSTSFVGGRLVCAGAYSGLPPRSQEVGPPPNGLFEPANGLPPTVACNPGLNLRWIVGGVTCSSNMGGGGATHTALATDQTLLVTENSPVRSGEIRVRCPAGGGTLTADDFTCGPSGAPGSATDCVANNATPAGGSCTNRLQLSQPIDYVTVAPPVPPGPVRAECMAEWRDYQACLTLQSYPDISNFFGGIACVEPPLANTCFNLANNPATSVDSGQPLFTPIPAPGGTCYCNAANPAIAAGQFCGWCTSQNFGYGVMIPEYEVWQCRGGRLNYVPGALGVVNLDRVTCSQGQWQVLTGTGTPNVYGF
jgi:hypothetical protein